MKAQLQVQRSSTVSGSRSVNARTVFKLLVPLTISVVLLLLGDWFLMATLFAEHRGFLRDVMHHPDPDGIEFNSDGIRDAREATAFRENDYNVIVMGDSFVYGELLWPYEAVPAQLERMAREAHPDLGINVANFGWTSASPYLSHRLLKDIGAKYRPDVVILCIDMSDFHDDIKYQRFMERPGAFKLLSVLPSVVFGAKMIAHRAGVHEEVFGYPSDRFFALNRPLEESRKLLAPIRRNIEAIADYTRDRLGAEFVLVVLPRHPQYSRSESPKDWERHTYSPDSPYLYEPFRFFEEMQAEVDFPIHSLLEAFEETEVFPTTFWHDPHWTAAGCAVAARALLDVLEQQRLGGEPAGSAAGG